MERFDLRSDTFTLPSEQMRRAIYQAEVGDDVYHEDPTVVKLEQKAARMLGKKDAVFVSSGSMGNLIGLAVNCGRGNEVLCARNAHIVHHEIASVATIAGCLPIQIDAPKGILTVDMLEGKVKARGVYDMAATTMVEVENTIGGVAYSIPNLKAIRFFADEHKMKIHMDGARLFNAALAEGVSVSDFAALADDVTFCLSKGLGAPAGSMLLSDDEDFIFQARRWKKMLGGGMRQIGFLAAAGLYALENNVDRLRDDHANAKAIAVSLSEQKWVRLDPDDVKSNIILFDAVGLDNESLASQLCEQGIICLTDGGLVRMVTSINLKNEEVPKIIKIIKNFTPVCGGCNA